MNKYEKYVDLSNVIGELAYDYGIPYISFDSLVILGQRAVKVYGLDSQSKHISFDTMCLYIAKYINTPFGDRILRELLVN